MENPEKLKVNIRYGYEGTFLSVVIEGENKNDSFGKPSTWAHHILLCAALRTMRQKGATVGKDPRINKLFPILNEHHAQGNWHGLEFKSEIFRNSFDINFFQNITPSENKNGGYSDFNKYEKFPYLIKIRLKVAIKTLIAALTPLCDATITFCDLPKKAEDRILLDYKKSWHKESISSLTDAQSTMDKYDLSQNNNDRDKKKIQCGDLKYFYSYDGYLHRGLVYHNCNNMWWVIENDITLRNVSAFELFDRTDEPIRKVLGVEKKISRLREELQWQIKAENFLRCNLIKKEIEKLKQVKQCP